MTAPDESATSAVGGQTANDFWVFGYGSLMWNPGFPFVERRPARLAGFRRAFCIYSTHHRGSQDKPGLVLGLDRGGVCDGAAYRVAEVDRVDVLGYLRAREQVSGVYREARVPLWMHDDVAGLVEVDGTAFIVEPKHPSYTGRLSVAEQARLIRAARGLSGPNVEYLINTWRQLTASGIRDRELERVVTAVGGLFATRPDAHVRHASVVLLGATRQQPPLAPRMKRLDRRRFMYRLKLDALGRGDR